MILDTHALSAFADGEPAVGVVLQAQGRVSIPEIVLDEYRYGIAGSRHLDAYEVWPNESLRHFEILEITDETTVTDASLPIGLRRAGKPIPANDAWIAELALQHKLPILSRDAHFDAVTGVRRVGW